MTDPGGRNHLRNSTLPSGDGPRDFDLQIFFAVASGFRKETHANLWVDRVCLQSVQHDFGEGMFENDAVTDQNDRDTTGFVFELGGLDWLIFASFLECFFNEWRERGYPVEKVESAVAAGGDTV